MRVSVDWMEQWANEPRFLITGVEPPTWPASTELAWERLSNMHRCDRGPFTLYFWTDGKPTNGFGGSTFKGRMQDGTPFEYVGAWSSRAGVVNVLWPDRKVVDVTVGYVATAIQADEIVRWWRENRPEWGLAWVTDYAGEVVLAPTRDGDLKRNTLCPEGRTVEHLEA